MAATQDTTVRAEDCLPPVDGELEAEGLDGAVRITRDRWGIPHVRAGSARDAFFAQGFCLGQERTWQVELYRQMAHGRAAALLNEGLLRIDRLNRRMGYGRDAAAEWEEQSDDARMILQAYADGINAALAIGPKPLEFHRLDHEMSPWSPVDSLAILKMVSANIHWSSKIGNARLAAQLGGDAAAALIPDVPEGGAMITPAGAAWRNGRHAWEDELRALQAEPGMRRGGADGSNCWVIDGAHTASGMPLVCGDPHLSLSVPAQWYLMHIECDEFTVAGPCSPGYPGPVYYGHNGRVAWTMTHAQGDRWDVYRERIAHDKAGGAPQAEYRGEPRTLHRRDELIEVRGGEPVTETVWSTEHGPVVQGDPTSDDEVLAARFALAEPCRDFDGMLPIFRAATIAEARQGFQRYDSISGNFCFADRDGNIGYQYTGRTPKRPAALAPVPGWDGAHEWDGEVPADELPQETNPEHGLIITANNRTTTPDYPHYLSWSQTPFRADRLRELLSGRDDWSADAMIEIQADQTSLHARHLAARAAAAPGDDPQVRELQQLLADWDARLSRDSAAGLVYHELCEQLARRTVRRFFDAPSRVVPGAPDERRILHEQLVHNSPLTLPDGQNWDDALTDALAETARLLRERHGSDPGAWRYGDAHKILWKHNLGRDPEGAATFNVGEIETGGDDMTPNNAGTLYGQPGDHGTSYRQIFDLQQLNGAQVCLPPGNSGRPGSPHYQDHLKRWRDVEYFPLYTEWPDIESNAESTLKLTPR